ncbi:MAG: ribonuclease [Thermoplasmata archaeon]|jgi:ribonuclease R|nr:ribonuclease [Thermoplasmata archaeon]
MSKPGDVVEFKPGTHGIEAPRNLGILLDRYRVKGVPWARLLTVAGVKETKAEHLTRRVFRERYAGDLRDHEEALARLKHLVEVHAKGNLAEEGEDDLGRLEEALWQATCRDDRESWTDLQIAQAHYGSDPSPGQLRDARAALDRCRRPGTGRFQTVGGRGDRWRPWSLAEHDRMRAAWEELQRLRRELVAEEETEEGRSFRRAATQPSEAARATLEWVEPAMRQFVEWDGVPRDGEPVRGIGGLGAVQAFGLDLHRQLGFLAQDWLGEHTSHSSDYVHCLLAWGLWSPQEAVGALIRRHVNQEEFFEHTEDPRAEEAAAKFAEPTLAEDPDRTDLRGLECHTIDPHDAKDFDDAVGIEDLGAGRVRLWVHIADVSHYVRLDTTLDRHARKRATSVYLPGRVLPMLPARISDNLCSLRSDGDRMALSVGLEVGADGRVEGMQFHKALIRVRENLAYETALQRARAGQSPFKQLMELADRMRQHRRGINLETGELKVILGAAGFSALEKRADDATRMIEMFMVAANEAVARHLTENKVPVLYRVHPLPDRDKAERLKHQLATMGIPAEMVLPGKSTRGAEAAAETLLDQLKKGGGKLQMFGGAVEAPAAPAPDGGVTAKVGFAALSEEEQDAWLEPFREVVDTLSDLPDAALAEIATIKVLGAMGRAAYMPENAGHFGLASTYYCHFTSPIRRYPDLVVHRNLKWLVEGSKGPAPHSEQSLQAMCDHCSSQERAADQLERRIKASCLVLAGDEMPTQGRVGGFTPVWMFVELEGGLDARIALRDLPGGPFQVDEWESMLYQEPRDVTDPTGWRTWADPDTGESRLVRARLGDRVRVQVAGRDVAAGRIGARVVQW